jgi:hypothetical protein
MKLHQSDNCGSAGLQRRHASATLFGRDAVRARRCSGAACRAPTGSDNRIVITILQDL